MIAPSIYLAMLAQSGGRNEGGWAKIERYTLEIWGMEAEPTGINIYIFTRFIGKKQIIIKE